MKPIKLVDLQGQYQRLKPEIDTAIATVLQRGDFIQGQNVKSFEQSLSVYLEGAQVISCANGTDALQIAMMALGLKPGGEVIVPVHTYVATAEVIALLRLVPVFVDVDPVTFMLDVNQVANAITTRTAAIVPVHLYGQCAPMEDLLTLARSKSLPVLEDTAQALGAKCKRADGSWQRAGSIGIIGTTSFFPSKNLGAYGDGGALITRDEILARQLRMIANHGQRIKYQHDVIGVNSRLDTIQAAILETKLTHLDAFDTARRRAADFYDAHLCDLPGLMTPLRAPWSTHVFHQYTIRVRNGKRDALQQHLTAAGIPTAIYYPIPLHLQKAYRQPSIGPGSFPVAELLSAEVLSLPIHTELEEDQLSYICSSIQKFFL